MTKKKKHNVHVTQEQATEYKQTTGIAHRSSQPTKKNMYTQTNKNKSHIQSAGAAGQVKKHVQTNKQQVQVTCAASQVQKNMYTQTNKNKQLIQTSAPSQPSTNKQQVQVV